MKTYKKSIEKIDENYYFSAFRLVINKPNPPFFVPYSWLFHHCHNLAKGGCLLTRFHFSSVDTGRASNKVMANYSHVALPEPNILILSHAPSIFLFSKI